MKESCGSCNETLADFRDGVCIHTDQVYDSCRERDCLEDLQVILTRCGQELVDRAINVKVKSAEVIWVFIDLDPVPFNKGFFTVDIKYFFKVTLDVFCGIGRPTEVEGLATFDKRVILFGSEGNSKIFTSKHDPGAQLPSMWTKNNLPKAVVEVVDPIALNAKLVDAKDCHCCCNNVAGIPDNICRCFGDDLVLGDADKAVFVTLGLFTIIKIERNVQLRIPAIDFCVPTRECLAATGALLLTQIFIIKKST
ncbi:MAG: hypothetical protein BWY15_02125 [Firmicutes bacterium ADurb.Bin193]|nr:MAG: hypothetical protein BWY15_02125 [Firmicutes bacterium ADurb.Bin193]